MEKPMIKTNLGHTQVKVKCMECGLHFIICTYYPERHALTTIYCPECGQHASRFILWKEKVKEFIFQVVPGEAIDYDTEF